MVKHQLQALAVLQMLRICGPLLSSLIRQLRIGLEVLDGMLQGHVHAVQLTFQNAADNKKQIGVLGQGAIPDGRPRYEQLVGDQNPDSSRNKD